MMRLLTLLSIAMLACGDDSPATNDTRDETHEVRIDGDDGDVTGEALDDASEADAEVIYPGHPCGGDQQCSTGLCYGIATPQGAFESPKCQTLCLGLEDFARYCDSDDDCCAGTCCLGCGAREGLCVPNLD